MSELRWHKTGYREHVAERDGLVAYVAHNGDEWTWEVYRAASLAAVDWDDPYAHVDGGRIREPSRFWRARQAATHALLLEAVR